MKVHVLGPALKEIAQTTRWYDRRVAGLGSEFHDRVVDALGAIERHPRRFSRVEWTPVKGEVRRARLTKFPHLLIYEIVNEEAFVIACSHPSRHPRYWQRRLRRRT
jgi:hypothetical protein